MTVLDPGRRAALAESVVSLVEAERPGTKLVIAIRTEARQAEQAFAKQLGLIFRNFGKQVAEASRAVVWDTSKVHAEQQISTILVASSVEEYISKVMRASYALHYESVFNRTERVLLQHGLKDITDARSRYRIIDNGMRRVYMPDIIGDARESMFKVLEDSRQAGLSPRKTSKMIEDYVPRGRYVEAGTSYRSTQIARTESMNAARRSSIDMYRAAQLQKLVAFDGEEDEPCAARNGQVFSPDEAEAECSDCHPNCVLAFAPA